MGAARPFLQIVSSKMSCGVTMDDSILDMFNEMKMKHTKRYMIFKIDSGKIVLDAQGDKDQTYEHFINAMPKAEPRYAVVDVQFTTDDGGSREKLVFIAWCPDDCGVKPKLLYSSNEYAIKEKFCGTHKSIRITSMDELPFDEVKAVMQ